MIQEAAGHYIPLAAGVAAAALGALTAGAWYARRRWLVPKPLVWGQVVSTENRPNVVFDDLSAAVDALEVGVDFLEQAEADVQRFRWVIITMHQAVQCFMVTALKGTEGIRPLAQNRKSVKEFVRGLLAYPARGGRFPSQPQALDSFLNLYAKVKDASPAGMGQLVTSEAFRAEPEDDHAIKKLNELRTRFVHFTTGTFVLDPASAIAPLRSALKLISFLAFESQNILWGAHPEHMQTQTRQLVARGGRSLDRLSAVYTSDRSCSKYSTG